MDARGVPACAGRFRLPLVAAVLLASAGAVAGQPGGGGGRLALVIGNSAYTAVSPLPNPQNDAADVGAALGRLGFDVTTLLDGDRAGMDEALRAFARRSVGAAAALIFYAGHGMEVDGVNYLLPVDARLQSDTDVEYETVDLDRVLRATEGATLRMVILDACRDNPLAQSMRRVRATRSISRGSFGDLDEQLLLDETLVAYAAAAGTTAADGVGRNSPYTEALLAYLEQPLEVSALFRRVRARVLETTGGRQRPHEYQSLLGDHYLSVRSAGAPGAADLFYADARPGAGASAPRIPNAGLKYRVLLRNPSGQPVEVDPDTAFRTGERIRLVFEPNIDGFLYVIQEGSTGRWSMLYPHPQMQGGRNDVARFREVEIPPAGWFRFDETPGVERILVYLSREKATALPGADGAVVRVESVAQGTVAQLTRTIRPRDLVYEAEEPAFAATGGAAAAPGGTVEAVYVVNQGAVADVVWETIELRHR